MFETSMVRAQPHAAKRRAGLFTISLIAHTAMILGVTAVSVASVDFPTAAPDEVAHAPVFAQIQIPPPRGTPDGGGAPPRPQPQVTPPPQPRPAEITAPPEIPDDVPVVETPGQSTSTATTSGEGAATGSPGRRGVPWGDPNSIATDLDLPPVTNTQPPVDDKIYVVSGEVTPPVALHKVAPEYPRALVPTRMRATVIVRCIIDRNGRVRDPQIISGSLPPFNAETIKAVTQWRFTPGSYRGQAVDVYFDLTVNFTIAR